MTQSLHRMVLVVDDEPGMRKIASRILQKRGYTVTEKTNGAEALDYLKADHGLAKYCLIVTDVQMPKMDGIEFTRRVRDVEELAFGRQGDHRSIPILITSGHEKNHYGQKLEAILNPKTAFLQKGYDLQTFLEALERLDR